MTLRGQSLGHFLGHTPCHRGLELACLRRVNSAGQSVDFAGRVNSLFSGVWSHGVLLGDLRGYYSGGGNTEQPIQPPAPSSIRTSLFVSLLF